ncbi:MAG: hypothetical protein EAX96_14585 [Candidatus Lokiarchaeota archaeon]|nr:hypothetical protein [Candidatus Lokiarchaeota archaeon]
MINWNPTFIKDAMKISNLEIAVKLITTIDPRGWPHTSLIAFNRAKTEKEVVWGQFTEGKTKKHVFDNPKQGLLFMTAEMPFKFVQAKVKFVDTMLGGEDCEYFSRLPMLRYATYFNVWRAFYNEVIAVSDVRDLGLIGILKGIIVNLIGKGGAKSKITDVKLQDFGINLVNGPINPKFISYIDPSDGFPMTIPCFQIRAPDPSKLIFTLSQFKEDLLQIPEESKIAVYALNMELENQLINGTFTGFQKFRGIKYGIIEIDEIYNSMPPFPGVIYPELQVRQKVISFE